MVKRKCPVCGIPYEADPKRLKHGRQTTCSRSCSYTQRGHKRTTAITKPCAVCGTLVSRAPSTQAQSKTESFLCSSQCHYKARSMGIVKRVVTKPYQITPEGLMAMQKSIRRTNAKRALEGRYGHTPETKEKLRIAAAKAIAEGRIPRVSSLEYLVRDILVAQGIPHQHQKIFRDDKGRFAALVDFFLPEVGVALEVNGTYWHSDPRVYPNGPIHPSQKRTETKYARKTKLLAALNIPLAEVWEMDIKEDIKKALTTALRPHLDLYPKNTTP